MKKNGYIQLCIDFKNQNQATKKDNYTIIPMEQILQCVLGSKMLSLLDVFSRYNQILVSQDDQTKTTFQTK